MSEVELEGGYLPKAPHTKVPQAQGVDCATILYPLSVGALCVTENDISSRLPEDDFEPHVIMRRSTIQGLHRRPGQVPIEELVKTCNLLEHLRFLDLRIRTACGICGAALLQGWTPSHRRASPSLGDRSTLLHQSRSINMQISFEELDDITRQEDAAALVCTETSCGQNHDTKTSTVLHIIFWQCRPT